MKNFFIGFLIVLVLIFCGMLLNYALFKPYVVDTSIDMAYDTVDKTMTAENAIYNYEYFIKQAESIQALRNKEIIAEQQLEGFYELYGKDTSKWTREDKAEHSRLKSNITGIQNMLENAMADYNAKSSMVNRAIFKDGLPSNINRAIIDGLQLSNN